MKLQITRPDDSRTFDAISSLAFALLLLLVLSTPFVEMSGELKQGQKVYRLYGYGLVALLHIALVPMRGWKRSMRVVSTPVSLFLLWCALSLAWTQHFDLTGKRLVLLGLVYCGTFAGVCDLSTQRSMGILRILLGATLILNFIVAVAVPDIGTHTEIGLWRGVMGHKNIAGMLCAITVILFAFDCGKIPVVSRGVAIAAALIFLSLTWSKTALISLPFVLAAGCGIVLIGKRVPSSSKDRYRLVLITALGVYGLILLGLILATLQQNLFLSLTDDTSKLTTRAAIWRPMIQFYLDHPLLGSGYGAYWDASANLVDTHARDAGMWKNVDQGHNGYLDLLVQVGLPGLMLALYAAFVWPTGVIADMVGKYPQRAALVVAILVFSLIENFSESSLFADDALGNAFLLIALAYVQRFALRSARKTRTGGRSEMISAAQLRSSRQRRHQGASEN